METALKLGLSVDRPEQIAGQVRGTDGRKRRADSFRVIVPRADLGYSNRTGHAASDFSIRSQTVSTTTARAVGL